MLAGIAAYAEGHRPPMRHDDLRAALRPTIVAEALSKVVENALETVPCAVILVPTDSGTTARMISRFKPSPWIIAFSSTPSVCQGLAFSYGIYPVLMAGEPENWSDFAGECLREHAVSGTIALLVAGPSEHNHKANYRIEFIRVGSE